MTIAMETRAARALEAEESSTQAGPEAMPHGELPHGERPDGELMQRTAAGDRDAFTVLVDRHKDGLVSYLARLTGCRDHAEDLAQESFLRLYQRAARYDDRGHFKAFLYRIATNLVRSEARRERRFRLLAPFLPAQETQRPEAAHRVLREEAQRKLSEAVTRLPLDYRVPLVLHEIEGWPYHEIAEQLRCRVGTIKSRIHRARKRLKEQLAPYWQSRTVWSSTQELNGETS